MKERGGATNESPPSSPGLPKLTRAERAKQRRERKSLAENSDSSGGGGGGSFAPKANKRTGGRLKRPASSSGSEDDGMEDTAGKRGKPVKPPTNNDALHDKNKRKPSKKLQKVASDSDSERSIGSAGSTRKARRKGNIQTRFKFDSDSDASGTDESENTAAAAAAEEDAVPLPATRAKRPKRTKAAIAGKRPARAVVDPESEAESDAGAGNGDDQSPRSGVTSPIKAAKPRPTPKRARTLKPDAESQGGADQPFQEGDIVWLKYGSLPMWPVRVSRPGSRRRRGSKSRPVRGALNLAPFLTATVHPAIYPPPPPCKVCGVPASVSVQGAS